MESQPMNEQSEISLSAPLTNGAIDEVVFQLIEKWKNGDLLPKDIRKTWCSSLSTVVNGFEKNGNWSQEIDKTVDDSIAILEKFIFNGYPTDYADQMRQHEEAISCCSVSSPFNIFYSCDDCKVATKLRVLCMECFMESEHRQHKYKIHQNTSLYCCCGENGTWEKPWSCRKHSVTPRQNEENNVSTADLENRARIVMEAIFLQIEDEEKNVNGSGGKFCVMVYTDYLFTSQQLRELFENVMNISDEECHQFSRKLINNGKITVKLPKKLCDAVQANAMKPGSHFQAIVLSLTQMIQQEFTFKILNYLQKVLKCSKKLREIFTEVITTPSPLSNKSIAERILAFSKALPKVFRDTSKELLIFGTMKQYITKKSLANRIIKNYDLIMHSVDVFDEKHSEFIFGIIRQLFGITDLSHDSIANQNVLHVVLNSFFEKNVLNFATWKNMKLKWKFDDNTLIQSDTCVNLVILLLKTVPKIWTKELRLGFLRGLSSFLKILADFQNVDWDTRQTEQHVEYERNNIAVIRLHKKLSLCATAFLKWCKSDHEIFTKAYEETSKVFHLNVGYDKNPEKLVYFLKSITWCLPYDSTLDAVSTCLPLSRFMVGLHLIKLDKSTKKDSLNSILVSKMLHPVLRIQVMSAQFNTGMWNRNGDPARARMEEYRSERGRIEIFDRDVQLLQIAAAMTETNGFLIQLLDKYGLMSWANKNFEQCIRHVADDEVNDIVCISEQFLQLLITVLIERHVPEVSYVTDEERVRHEIIQRLCIEPVSHFELEEYFEWAHLFKSPCYETVLKEVAILKKPTSLNEYGKYELRTELYENYNPLYYHYTPEEMSKAREFQRDRRKYAKEPDCFPPRRLPKLKEFFAPMVGIFQSDVTFHIMFNVLQRACEPESRSYSDVQLESVLYLIGYALQEEKSGNYSALSFTKRAAEWKILDLLESVLAIPRVGFLHDLLKWTIRECNEVAGAMANVRNDVILYDENENVSRSKLVAAKRAIVMQEMSNMQKQFMTNNSTFDQTDVTEFSPDDSLDSLEKTCILCQETQTLDLKNEALVTSGCVQYSTVLCHDRENQSDLYDSPLLTCNLGPAFYTSSCGHIMHLRCFKTYLKEILEREANKSPTDYSSGFDFKVGEFLCPLCESFSNVVLPLIPEYQVTRGNGVKFSKNLRETLLAFTDKLQTPSSKSPLLVWKSLSYTIHVIENVLRHTNKPLLGHLSSRHHACLESFVKISEVITHFYPITESYSTFVENLHDVLKGENMGSGTNLGFDIFNLWVVVTLSGNPSPFLLRLVLVAQIVKILMTTNFNDMINDDNRDEETPFKHVLQLLKERGTATHLSENFVWSYVKNACRPFLRCCVILHSFLSGVPQPAQLTEVGGDTFSNMCSYLGLPQIREKLFHRRDVYPIVKTWFKNFLVERGEELIETNPFRINQLIKLPHEYCDLISMATTFECFGSKSSTVCNDPMVCLMCGTTFCFESRCIALMYGQVSSPLHAHAMKCHEQIYLRVLTNEIEIRSTSELRLSFMGPYLNDYFENDADLSEQNPMYLLLDVYKHFHTLWLNHGLLEEVSRQQR